MRLPWVTYLYTCCLTEHDLGADGADRARLSRDGRSPDR